jgi:hypothetical protein
MKNRIIALVVGMVLLMVASLLAQAPDTLILDDGTEFFSNDFNFSAQKFSPAVLCTLEAVILKTSELGVGCSLFVWNDSSGSPQSSSDLISPIYFVSAGQGVWKRIDLPVPIEINDDFWIGIYTSMTMGVEYDNSPNCHSRFAESDDKIFWWVYGYHEYGEFLIRPIVTLTGSRHDVSCINISSSGGFFLPNPSSDSIDIVVKNFGNVTEIDVPIYLRITDSLGQLVLFDSQNIDSIKHNEIITTAFQWNYNQNGDYIIEGYPWLSNDCVRDNDELELKSYIRTYPGELYYDDIESTISGYFQYEFANKFFPPYYPCKIESVKFAFDAWSSGSTYTFGIGAAIMEDDSPGGSPGTIIEEDSVLGLTGPGTYWYFTMDFSSHNTIIYSGGFFAKWKGIPDSTTLIGSPALWLDDGNPPFAMMTWAKGTMGNWFQWWRHADATIRVCVDYPSAVDEEARKSSSSNYLSINPTISNGKFKCSFSIPKDKRIEIDLHSIDGRRVSNLFTNYVKKGIHYFYPDVSDQPQGIYFVLMKGDGFVEKKKLILIR